MTCYFSNLESVAAQVRSRLQAVVEAM